MKFSPEEWLPPLVVVAGTGMGKADLGAAALEWIDKAEVLAGGQRLLDLFPDHPARKRLLGAPIDVSLDRLRSLSLKSRTAVLASGDPFFFGIGRRLVGCFGKENILAFPNVTAVQALFARLGEPWDDVKAVSLHGREDSLSRGMLRDLRTNRRLVVLTDPRHTPSWIAQQLLDAGFDDRILVTGEDLGLPSEKIRRLSLGEASMESFSPLNVVAILAGDRSNEKPESAPESIFGFPEEDFRHQAGLITKLEVRAIVLAYLRLEANQVFWDLGAGSGSISIEASRVAPMRRIVAVEEHSERFQYLRENIRRFRCAEIEAICGKASEVLDTLPDPDRVFIGGSGDDLETILDHAASRLRPGGRVVQTAVTLETLDRVRTFWQAKGFELSIGQIQVNRSSPIGRRLRFEAVNPVFIISVWRQA